VGHAVSTDLVHWKQSPSIYTKGKVGQWNEDSTFTGMEVHHEGKFYMFIGSTWNNRQVVGVYISNDLYNWQPYSNNPVMIPCGPYYMSEPKKPYDVDLRDPCITYRQDDAYYHALLCARRPNFNSNDTGAAIAHLRSKDLLHWEYLPPINADVSRFYNTEVPDIFKLNEKYYLLFSTISFGGLIHNTPSREYASGSFYLVSDNIDGPYHFLDEYLLIGSANTKMGPYVARTIPYKGGRLLYHHIKSMERTAFCTTKMVLARKDHSLYLAYMPNIEKLETDTLISSLTDISDFDIKDQGVWKRTETNIIGSAGVVGTACTIVKHTKDFHIECTLKSITASNVGLALRYDPNSEGYLHNNGVLLNLDFVNNKIEIGCSRHNQISGWGPDIDAIVNLKSFYPWDICKYKLEKNVDYAIRCFARGEFFEVYINDEWVLTVVLDNAPKIGGVQLVVAKGEALFSKIRVAEIEGLE
jgi:hypothetical protein